MNNKTMSFILIVIVVVVFIWVVSPVIQKYIRPILNNESFENGNKSMPAPVQRPHGPVQKQRIAHNVGSIVAGPGYETPDYGRVFQPSTSSVPSNYYFLDDGDGGHMSIQYNLCSKSCCSKQWPLPFKLKEDAYVCANKDKFVPSRIMCNNSFQDSGCLCLTKDQARFIYNRGNNGREWF